MQFKSHENNLANPQQAAEPVVFVQRERKRSCLCRKIVDVEGGEQKGWCKVLV